MATRNTQNEINLFEAVQQFSSERGLPKDSIMTVIKESLVAAYKKKLNKEEDDSFQISVEIGERNDVVLVVHKLVVQDRPSTATEISYKEARELDPNIQVGNTIPIKEKPIDLSRIVSNQARQMVFQRLKEMERENLYKEYKAKEGELTHGYFQRFVEKDTMSIDLGKVEGIMPRREQTPNEKYKNGDRLKAIISKVEIRKDKFKDAGLVIILSRSSGDFVKKLFEMEIPEIYDGIVKIIDIARIPSIRTKIVVQATRGDIDPVGACVGMKGVRIQSIVRELGNERIDIIQYSENPVEYITNLISPAKPQEVKVDTLNREALIVVPDEVLSLAIGTSGSNVKLAAQLCKYKIDIKSQSQYNEEMTSPEARERLDRLFNPKTEDTDEAEEYSDEGTPLSEIPSLTKRVIELLKYGGVNDVETLIDMSQDDLVKIPGIGVNTAEQIMKLLRESVELVEEG